MAAAAEAHGAPARRYFLKKSLKLLFGIKETITLTISCSEKNRCLLKVNSYIRLLFWSKPGQQAAASS